MNCRPLSTWLSLPHLMILRKWKTFIRILISIATSSVFIPKLCLTRKLSCDSSISQQMLVFLYSQQWVSQHFIRVSKPSPRLIEPHQCSTRMFYSWSRDLLSAHVGPGTVHVISSHTRCARSISCHYISCTLVLDTSNET